MPPRLGALRVVVALGLVWLAATAVLKVRMSRSAPARQAAAADPIHASMTEPAGPAPTDPGTLVPPPPGVVGIIAGHWQYDSGTVCPDGLREVDVTTDVAWRIESILEQRGYQVAVLPEHDPDAPGPPLLGYRAAALVSLHVDSCEATDASGFKVARWELSVTPEEDDRLVACLEGEYARQTLLPRHDDSITSNMTNYYALREIAPETPGAIIELGFLGGDRAFFDAHRYEAALGVADGIVCFLGSASGAGG